MNAPSRSLGSPTPQTAFVAAVPTQAQISAEIARLGADFRRPDSPETQPRLDYPPYRSSIRRHPTMPAHKVNPSSVELTGPVFGAEDVDPSDADLTIQHVGPPIGERTVVAGRVTDGTGRPVAGQLVEIWQANAAGRYRHHHDQHDAPIDPNFTGVGRCLTAADGTYRFTTIKPGPYPWRNHDNAWRPAHIHFSLFGSAFTQRLVTQMYFPGDPLSTLDPIYHSIRDHHMRALLIADYDHTLTRPETHTGYRWDIVLSGARATWTEPDATEPRR